MKHVGIIGDFNPANPTHIGTNEAIRHAADKPVHAEWIASEVAATDAGMKQVSRCDGLWIAPASPYRSMDGALRAIRWGRENQVPVLGTCGGFQHIILEHARNVLGIATADHEESNPHGSALFISRLACSLVGRTMTITLGPDSLLARLHGGTTTQEKYYCNFGVNPNYVETLRRSALRVAAWDEEGEVRAVELPTHPFFVGTLFLPQQNSTPENPHPIVRGFLRALN